METQTERLRRYLYANPGASGMEIITTLRLPKYTSRISDLRAQGVDVRCERGRDGVRRYRIVEVGQTELGL
jgi:hypothetical protein